MVYKMKKSEIKKNKKKIKEEEEEGREVERYKPRMVHPALGINWDEIFALVSCLEIIPQIITRIA